MRRNSCPRIRSQQVSSILDVLLHLVLSVKRTYGPSFIPTKRFWFIGVPQKRVVFWVLSLLSRRLCVRWWTLGALNVKCDGSTDLLRFAESLIPTGLVMLAIRCCLQLIWRGLLLPPYRVIQEANTGASGFHPHCSSVNWCSLEVTLSSTLRNWIQEICSIAIDWLKILNTFRVDNFWRRSRRFCVWCASVRCWFLTGPTLSTLRCWSQHSTFPHRITMDVPLLRYHTDSWIRP